MTIRAQLQAHEGLRLRVYRCPAGYLSIGVGRNLETLGLTEQEAMLLLDNDISRCRMELTRTLPWTTRLSAVRQDVLVDMVFNLGLPKFLSFRNMLEALGRDDYATAAMEMLNSRWARQVGQRARTLAYMMAHNLEFENAWQESQRQEAGA